jgi:hypothetical protein
LFTLTSQDGFEIDLIIETPGAPLTVCELKSVTTITSDHLKSLRAAKKDFPDDTRYFVLSQDAFSHTEDGIQCLFWRKFLQQEFPINSQC